MLPLREILVVIVVLALVEWCENAKRSERILCWIPTDPKNHERASHVKNTWGRRCDHLLFFSTEYDDTLPTIVVDVAAGHQYLWQKVRKAIIFIYSTYVRKAGWFLKADDDTYVIMENVRDFLNDYSSSEPWFFGKRFNITGHKGYMNGGAGYILSRKALKKLVEVGLKYKRKCYKESTMPEDKRLGLCLEDLGVEFGNTTDSCCKDRFFPLSIEEHTQSFSSGRDTWMWDDAYYVTLPGIIGCSNAPISFHRVTPRLIVLLILTQLHALDNWKSANKILCWIPTDPANYDRSLHVKNTWGKRCNYLLFFSNDLLPTIRLRGPSGWDYLWGKVRKALKFIYALYLAKAEWFLKADDDTYVVMENLRFFLKDYNSSESWYFGKRFKYGHHMGYMHGGAGYVLSRGALRKLVEIGFPNKQKCSGKVEGHEDLELGLCLEYVGAIFGNTTDEPCKDRFLALGIERRAQPFRDEVDSWTWEHMFYTTLPGIVCCSQSPISFHKVTPGYMYALEYLLYHVNVVLEV